MMKMKLLMKTAEAGADGPAQDGPADPPDHTHIPGAAPPLSPVAGGGLEEPARQPVPPPLDKETVFEWFGLQLEPARRLELMCGLLHMCQPLELRFLGSYLEDLARKDYHVLRDFEFRANSPGELGLLSDVLDPVVRSKLLVSLSLLGSDSRECAGILFRILSHVDPGLFCKNYACSLPPFRDPHHPHPHLLHHHPVQDGTAYGRSEPSCGLSVQDTAVGPLEQLALLFTMASLHPAFHFHQREIVRGQLDKIELSMEEDGRTGVGRRSGQSPELLSQKVDYLSSSSLSLGECSVSCPPCQSRCSGRWTNQREAVHIEGIVLRSISRTRVDKEYNFEVKWSDSSSTCVTKTHLELENFLLKLPKDQCIESFEKGILRLLNQGEQYESREVENNLRERFLSAPPVFRQTRKVCTFFNCGSSYSTKPSCCRCHCPRKSFPGDCSDASSQEEDLESFVQGHKKKHGTKSPCRSNSSAKGPPMEGRRGGGRTAELNGPVERRKKSCPMRSNQEVEQHQEFERKSHTVSKAKSRVGTTDRDTGSRTRAVKGAGPALVSNGDLGPALSPQRTDGGSGPDTFGDTSSDSYSSPSSPRHRGEESVDSEDDNNKDTDSHSDDSAKGHAHDLFSPPQTHPSVGGRGGRIRRARTEPFCPESTTDYPPLTFMQTLPYVLPNGAGDAPLPVVPPPPGHNVVPDGKSASTAVMMQMPLVPPAVGGPSTDPDKRELLPTFGLPPLGLHSPGGPAAPPLVHRFKTVLPHSQGVPDGASGTASTPSTASIRAVGVLSAGPTSFSPLQPPPPCQDPSGTGPLPLDTPHAKHPGLTLPSGLPSSYTLPVPAPVMPAVGAPTGLAPSPGHVQVAVPPAVPTHTPGPAPNLSPALTHSTAHSDCTSYSNSSVSCGTAAPGNSAVLTPPQQQQAPPQQPTQPPAGCGTCGCHNNCGGRGGGGGSSTACQAPMFFPAHQMAAAARQVFSLPPHLFQLTSMCSNSFLSQAQAPHQANGANTMPPFFPAAPPPYGPSLHNHSHSHADVPSHMLGTAAAVAAAANYNLQQQMAPAASFCQRVYQHVYPNPLGMLPPATLGGGGVNKKNGNVSCYNCGVSGHYAQDCSQPPLESTQTGGFRLKYSSSSHVSETLDNTD
ncbi:zinc finger CCHC domain-containing protein 2 isoform X2 [Sphaeramia orbicularis]|uniref:zinc finger CCHC domain-containing protein 2 isoform X2 n=1 Tax=Sphaeramia orbicularis TaxID=375764 RepID=UPI001180689E|nr:zinc finger CCHC domain-containing protein 2 isoform X2 [Sphaeramia orbicularis]